MKDFLSAPARKRDGFISVGEEEDESWRDEGEGVSLGSGQGPWPGSAHHPGAPAVVSSVDLALPCFREQQPDLRHLEMVSHTLR